ncbi:MAG: hypothetical protein N2450_05390 [bacterium]|nr:hypothetical protein [bacterium]
MELVLILSTFINFVTLIVLVIVIASYLTLKMKERKTVQLQKQNVTDLVAQEKLPTSINITNTPPIPVQVSVALSQTNHQSLGNTTQTQYHFLSERSIPVKYENGSWRLGFRSTL